ncbi:hypothetical protein [Microbispora amethystogenes]|uniref:Uncharacterized protein n=1 Tax=Microbispora amethystogenes TaxID=1427754 RepID=A0ABQ4FBP5_9ACTN|nr:hypothetical protein [Microbispora amethystogenes]GIH32214.1 hypothetical protein Mam01_23780 [Microbispora amethystogenes]
MTPTETVTETELRDLLAGDAATAGSGGVTLAGVDRRVRRLRRRRAGAGAVLAAGLAAAVTVAATPRTVTIAPPGDGGPAAVAAVPTVGSYLTGERVFLSEAIETGGRVLTFTYTGISESVNVRVECRDPSYALVWLNGRLVTQGVCGIQSDDVDHAVSWTDESGGHLRGTNDVAVALVPVQRVAAGLEAGAPVPALGEREAERVIGESGEYRTGGRLTIRDAWPLVAAPTPISCDQDIVIRNPNGQEILSSACGDPTVVRSPGWPESWRWLEPGSGG